MNSQKVKTIRVCPKCKGLETVTVSGETHVCPACNGSGYEKTT